MIRPTSTLWPRPPGRDRNGVVRADNEDVRQFQSRRWAWWYLTIALGFLLLAIVYLLQGAGWTDVALRAAVAVGFAALGWMQLRFGR